MKNNIRERVLKESSYILKTNDTIRKTAQVFEVSKSTVHYDVSSRLKDINFILFLKVKSVLFRNFSEKHLRGGQATANRFNN